MFKYETVVTVAAVLVFLWCAREAFLLGRQSARVDEMWREFEKRNDDK